MDEATELIPLRYAGRGKWAALRELSGWVEDSVRGVSTRNALSLVDWLLVAAPGAAVTPGSAMSLTASERDCILAAVYAQAYGPQVESAATCDACGSRFDVDFVLGELMDSMATGAGGTRYEVDASGVVAAEGARFRLPTGEDECAVMGLEPATAVRALLERCLIEGDPERHLTLVQEAMEQAAPVLDVDLQASCPECGATQALHFDLQHYLLSALLREQHRLAVEVHKIARAYGWSYSEIMAMRRSQRRRVVALIDGERSAWWTG